MMVWVTSNRLLMQFNMENIMTLKYHKLPHFFQYGKIIDLYQTEQVQN
jgi:hypothetical protein